MVDPFQGADAGERLQATNQRAWRFIAGQMGKPTLRSRKPPCQRLEDPVFPARELSAWDSARHGLNQVFFP
jgi:hypothetical protein